MANLYFACQYRFQPPVTDTIGDGKSLAAFVYAMHYCWKPYIWHWKPKDDEGWIC